MRPCPVQLRCFGPVFECYVQEAECWCRASQVAAESSGASVEAKIGSDRE